MARGNSFHSGGGGKAAMKCAVVTILDVARESCSHSGGVEVLDVAGENSSHSVDV